MRRALVVAHPDDEVMWFGGLLIAEPGDWHIFCASTPRVDPERSVKFIAACKMLGAVSAHISPLTESPADGPLDRLAERIPDLSAFDQIVTHNSRGEYGHKHHVSVHGFIAERWPERIITGGYGMPEKPKRVAMTEDQYACKVEALKAYDHVSPTDGCPKWRALLARYGGAFDLRVETYDR
jgi:LmbE family N-acetylglucosaminyl deacetylase